MGLDSIFHKRSFAFLLLSLLIIIIYSNTFYASWHLDDRPNIVNNYYLHLDSLHPGKLVKTFFTDNHNPEQLNNRTYRPVACLTFALNWYFGQDNVVGYHIVNTVIHIITAFFLFIFILNLFDTPSLKNNYLGHPVFIAFLASILWAANPIQTQAVTYIVQRMAQLAALFYILGLYAYIKARLSNTFNRRFVWFSSCLAFYLLGVNSKPNAAMMPMAIVLIEIVFFQNLSDRKTKKKVFLAASIIAVLILLAGSAVFLRGDPLSFLDLYSTRTFTLSERLLTQPRVILFYLSQIFIPMPDRFSIAHDIVLSSSLLKPWTTIPGILIIFILIGFSVSQIIKRPILSFAILFFFINHIIESSIIALEIIFEHRNYLPSFFLFLPVAYLLNYLLIVYKTKNKAFYASTIFIIISLVAFFSVSTFIRNQVWKDDITLWTDAVSKAPNNARALNILAIKLAWGDNSKHPNRYDMALKLFEDSLKKHLPSSYVKADIYSNMALIYFHSKDDPQKAFKYFYEALKIHPENLKNRRKFVEALIINKNFESALEHVDILLSKKSDNGRYLNLKGHILLWQQKYKEALSFLKTAYPISSDKTSIILDTSVCLSLSGSYAKAEQLLMDAIEKYPDSMVFYLAIMENSIRSGEGNKATIYLKKMFQQFDREEIVREIENYTDNPRYAPISKKLIMPIIENERRRKIKYNQEY
ncbi:MAG: hypothetical protein K8S13_16770 [Desulfobacula sp.]|uniref:tetratricopeptide repeat protein n=1 Tax=Desulfobacula sp. TaxID=2593537 RepID=UPI0025BB01F7|nr:tetratricopeptide repeat protein [Desulfobacula sp.]MCD4721494.1 hypothetical protein [Desulfobacula sp.]